MLTDWRVQLWENILRRYETDSVAVNDSTDDILKNTKNKNQDFFTVPKIVE